MEKAFHARVLLLEPHLTSQECAQLMLDNGMTKDDKLYSAPCIDINTMTETGVWIIQPVETH